MLYLYLYFIDDNKLFLNMTVPIYSSTSLVADGKESACSAGDPGSIPWSGRSPGEGNGYPLQYSCLENSMDRGGAVHGIVKS